MSTLFSFLFFAWCLAVSTNCPSVYDLPPSIVAEALPVGKARNSSSKTADPNANSAKQKKKCAPRNNNFADDDTPRAFSRLLNYHQKQKAAAGVFDNPRDQKKASEDNKKRKRAETEQVESDGDNDDNKATVNARQTKKKATSKSTKDGNTPTAPEPTPKILPGEKFSDFAARVDRALPLSGMKKSAKPVLPPELAKLREQPRTKHEKRLLRLQKQWREEEERIRDREDEEREEREAQMEDQIGLWKQWDAEARAGKAKKKNKKNKSKH